MKYFLPFLILFSTSLTFGQVNQLVYSNSAISGATEYNVIDATQTMDQGYLVLTHSTVSPRVEIIKLDADGNIVWQQAYQTSNDPAGGEIQEHSNGNIIVAFAEQQAFIRTYYLDAVGAIIWTNLYYVGGDLVVGDKVGVAIDGNALFPEFIIYGALGSSGVPYVFRVGNTGAIIWQKWYNDIFGIMNNVTIEDMIVSATGDIFGVISGNGTNYVMKLNSLGQMTILKTTNYNLYDLLEVNGGDILAVGSVPDIYGNEDAAYLLMGATNLDEIENGSFGSSNYETATCVVENTDNTWSLGVLDNSTGDTKMAIYKLNGSNGLQWSKAYGGSDTDTPAGIFQKADGGWTIIGTSNSFSPNNDQFIVMTDDNGITIGCQEDLIYTLTSNNSFNFDPFSGNTFNSSLTVFNTSGTSVPFSTTPVIPFPTTSIIGNDPLCNGVDGSIDLSVTDGMVPYAYTWSNGTSAQDVLSAAAGNYTVVVEDANGCMVHDTVDLVDPPAISTTESHTNVSCAGASDGTINITVSGGTPSYSYLWTYNSEVTEDLNGIPGGFYQITVTDANGCQKNHSISVSEPTPLVAGISSATDPSCHDLCDGSLTGIVSGGTAPYNYQWNDPGTQTTAIATNLCAGNFLLTVNDVNGCSTIASGNLTNPDELLATVTTSPTECGVDMGSAVANPTGGTMPYSYNWPSGATGSEDSLLSTGTFVMQVIDANGCITDQTFEILPYVDPVQICLITVDSTSTYNEVVWEKPVAANIEGFKIYRNIAGSYDEIGFVPYANLSVFQDQTFGVDPNVTSYRYKVSVVDTCGNESDLSDFHETIHLTSSEGLGGENNLIWDNYEGFSFVNYNILKDTTDNGIYDWYTADQVSSISFTWTDLNPQSYTNYAIQVVPTDPCTATHKATDYNSSRSNNSSTVVLGPGSSIEENSAFKHISLFPNPNNGNFNLELDFIESGQYSIAIYGLNGQLIYADNEFFFEGNQFIEYSDLNLDSGIYMMVISNENSREQMKFTVMNGK